MKINKMLVVGLLALGFGAVSQIEAVAHVTVHNDTGMAGFIQVTYTDHRNPAPGVKSQERKNIAANGSVRMPVESGRAMYFSGLLGNRVGLNVTTSIPQVLHDGQELVADVMVNPNRPDQGGIFLRQ